MSDAVLSGSYSEDDVIFLLKEISGLIEEKGNEEREKAIQNGVHYSEMLPVEYHPTKEYMDVFYKILGETKEKIAYAVSVTAEKILKLKGSNIILASLARAGTPIGILIKRYIKFKYNVDIPHYSISIIRGRGIDEKAVLYMLNNHRGKDIQFIDGWTGKGAIQNTLNKACEDFYEKYGIHLDNDMAVLSDPACCCSLYGTREDFLIPSACLNATVSGLMSRTVYNRAIISEDDFHGARFYREWSDIDVSNLYVDTISQCFSDKSVDDKDLIGEITTFKGFEDVRRIQEEFHISDINLIKPGVGETTRVLLRRIPWKILIDSFDNPNLKHILILARERCVPVEIYKSMSYSCCGLIKSQGKAKGDI